MGRFDVYPSPGKNSTGFVLDVQADLLNELATRVVVPLLPQDTAPKPARGLNRAFEIDGRPHLTLTQFIAAVAKKSSLENQSHGELTACPAGRKQILPFGIPPKQTQPGPNWLPVKCLFSS
jgi:toxin CcdB